jgi:hypothetical protein
VLHLSEADKISLPERRTINPITAITPYSGRPMSVIMVIAPAEELAALETALVETTLVNMSLFY